MRNFVIRLLMNAFALSAAAWLIDGIRLSEDFGDILIVALIFGVLNALLKPILLFLSIPFIVVTLGFFALVVNGGMLLLTARLSDSLVVDGLGSAILGAIVISIVTMILGGALDDEKKSKSKR
ncbi:MAG: phage holin family protein [Gemmatimonadota bacterium]